MSMEKNTIGIRGEYWFDSRGDIMYADGDNGDKNHEMYVVEKCTNDLLSYFGFSSDEDIGIISPESHEENSILAKISDDEDFLIQYNIDPSDLSKREIFDELSLDGAEAIMAYLIYNEETPEKASEIVLTAYGSTTDARELAVNRWNWKRVHGDSIESKQLTPKDLKIIASGISSAIEEEGLYYDHENDPDVLELHPYTVSTYTGKRFKITLRDMESGSVASLERGDLENTNTAAKGQLKKIDQKEMPDFYKGHFGDSVTPKFDKILLECKNNS